MRPAEIANLLTAGAFRGLFSLSTIATKILPAAPLPAPTGRYSVHKSTLSLLLRSDPPSPIIDLWTPAGRRGLLPVLVYFSSWSGTAIDNAALIGELASHGFAIASVRYAPQRDRERPMDFSSEAAYRQTIARGHKRVRKRAEDAVAILVALAETDVTAGLPVDGLDFDKAGIFGFSFGGAVAAEACRLDKRFKAAINMDGWHFGDAAESGIEQPYLLMSDDTPAPAADPRMRGEPVDYAALMAWVDARSVAASMMRNGGMTMTIAGTRHVNFSDTALQMPIRRIGGAGRIAAARAHEIIAAYTRAFFATYLESRPDCPVPRAGDERYPEVKLRIWDKPQ